VFKKAGVFMFMKGGLGMVENNEAVLREIEFLEPEEIRRQRFEIEEQRRVAEALREVEPVEFQPPELSRRRQAKRAVGMVSGALVTGVEKGLRKGVELAKEAEVIAEETAPKAERAIARGSRAFTEAGEATQVFLSAQRIQDNKMKQARRFRKERRKEKKAKQARIRRSMFIRSKLPGFESTAFKSKRFLGVGKKPKIVFKRPSLKPVRPPIAQRRVQPTVLQRDVMRLGGVNTKIRLGLKGASRRVRGFKRR